MAVKRVCVACGIGERHEVVYQYVQHKDGVWSPFLAHVSCVGTTSTVVDLPARKKRKWRAKA